MSRAECPVSPEAMEAFLPKGHPPVDGRGSAGCPVDHSTFSVDPATRLPSDLSSTARQPGQRAPLSTERTLSTIPRAYEHEAASASESATATASARRGGSGSGGSGGYGGHAAVDGGSGNKSDKSDKSDDVWVYPSEQMFFNAVRRKNKSISEDDMGTVVGIHNAVNEMCWVKILEWEALHKDECSSPRLLRFQGKPTQHSPKALFKHHVLGYKLPFDRHDWIVDRCGQRVRYIIDFYAGNQKNLGPDAAAMPAAFYLDVRPAATPSGVYDRLRRLFGL